MEKMQGLRKLGVHIAYIQYNMKSIMYIIYLLLYIHLFIQSFIYVCIRAFIYIHISQSAYIYSI